MKLQTISKDRNLTQTKRGGKYPPKRLEAVQMQEQFSGPLPQRNERPAADVLAEAEAGPTVPVFIP